MYQVLEINKQCKTKLVLSLICAQIYKLTWDFVKIIAVNEIQKQNK